MPPSNGTYASGKRERMTAHAYRKLFKPLTKKAKCIDAGEMNPSKDELSKTEATNQRENDPRNSFEGGDVSGGQTCKILQSTHYECDVVTENGKSRSLDQKYVLFRPLLDGEERMHGAGHVQEASAVEPNMFSCFGSVVEEARGGSIALSSDSELEEGEIREPLKKKRRHKKDETRKLDDGTLEIERRKLHRQLESHKAKLLTEQLLLIEKVSSRRMKEVLQKQQLESEQFKNFMANEKSMITSNEHYEFEQHFRSQKKKLVVMQIKARNQEEAIKNQWVKDAHAGKPSASFSSMASSNSGFTVEPFKKSYDHGKISEKSDNITDRACMPNQKIGPCKTSPSSWNYCADRGLKCTSKERATASCTRTVPFPSNEVDMFRNHSETPPVPTTANHQMVSVLDHGFALIDQTIQASTLSQNMTADRQDYGSKLKEVGHSPILTDDVLSSEDTMLPVSNAEGSGCKSDYIVPAFISEVKSPDKLFPSEKCEKSSASGVRSKQSLQSSQVVPPPVSCSAELGEVTERRPAIPDAAPEICAIFPAILPQNTVPPDKLESLVSSSTTREREASTCSPSVTETVPMADAEPSANSEELPTHPGPGEGRMLHCSPQKMVSEISSWQKSLTQASQVVPPPVSCSAELGEVTERRPAIPDAAPEICAIIPAILPQNTVPPDKLESLVSSSTTREREASTCSPSVTETVPMADAEPSANNEEPPTHPGPGEGRMLHCSPQKMVSEISSWHHLPSKDGNSSMSDGATNVSLAGPSLPPLCAGEAPCMPEKSATCEQEFSKEMTNSLLPTNNAQLGGNLPSGCEESPVVNGVLKELLPSLTVPARPSTCTLVDMQPVALHGKPGVSQEVCSGEEQENLLHMTSHVEPALPNDGHAVGPGRSSSIHVRADAGHASSSSLLDSSIQSNTNLPATDNNGAMVLNQSEMIQVNDYPQSVAITDLPSHPLPSSDPMALCDNSSNSFYSVEHERLAVETDATEVTIFGSLENQINVAFIQAEAPRQLAAETSGGQTRVSTDVENIRITSDDHCASTRSEPSIRSGQQLVINARLPPNLLQKDPLENELSRIQCEQDLAFQTCKTEKERLLAECQSEMEKVKQKYGQLILDLETMFQERGRILENVYKTIQLNQLLAMDFRTNLVESRTAATASIATFSQGVRPNFPSVSTQSSIRTSHTMIAPTLVQNMPFGLAGAVAGAASTPRPPSAPASGDSGISPLNSGRCLGSMLAPVRTSTTHFPRSMAPHLRFSRPPISMTAPNITLPSTGTSCQQLPFPNNPSF